jgi:hypothetical protein
MKVIENAPDRLVVEQTGWAAAVTMLIVLAVLGWQFTAFRNLGGPGVPLFFILAGVMIVAGLLSIKRHQVWADRSTGTFAVRQRSILGLKEQVRPLTDLQEATVTSRRGNKGRRRYRCELVLQGGERLPLAGYGGEAAARTATAAINLWLGKGAVPS